MMFGPGGLPESTAELAGSTAIALNSGLRSLMTSVTPVIVPPVPTPATRISTLPSVSRQISSAVVRRWISGFAGLLNCCGDHRVADPVLHAAQRVEELELRQDRGVRALRDPVQPYKRRIPDSVID